MVDSGTERLEALLKGQDELAREAYAIIEGEQRKDDALRARVLSSLSHGVNHIRDMEPYRLYHVEDIRKTCVKYRLRFLPTGRFKGAVPDTAIYALRRLASRAEAPLAGFRIMAPGKQFSLCDCDADPLLFVPVGDDRYYLVHRWGADLSPWRAIWGWPMRGWRELAIMVVVVAWAVAALLPTPVISMDPAAGWWGPHRVFAFFWTTMFGTAATLFSWFTFFGQFSSEAWNSKTFN
jgi:hypothetical protein